MNNWQVPFERDAKGRRIRSKLTGMAFIEAMSMPEPNTGCWLWLGGVDSKGYGIISRACRGEGSPHRYSLACRVGPLGSLHALHKCDQPGCVNPDHLIPGTIQDNNEDMRRKGRNKVPFIKGQPGKPRKLTADAVRFIRQNYRPRDPEWSFTALGARFGVSKVMAAYAYHGSSWSHVK